MQTEKIGQFKIIGIAVRTKNHSEQTAKDIGGLWDKFFSEQIIEKIPNKLDRDIYALYTNYEGDHNQPYDTIIGCKVSSLDEIPEGMVGQSFEASNYRKTIAKGDLTQGLLYQSWKDIWAENWERTYAVDFERYGEKASNPKDAEVEIFVSVA